MIVELSTGYIVPGTRSPAFRNTVSVSPRAAASLAPAQVLARDVQGLAPAGRLGGALAAMKGAARGIDAAQGLAAAAQTGLDAIAAALADMKVLSEAAAEATVSTTDRAILNAAFDALREEIAAIVDRTTYDGVKVLDGDGGASRSFTFSVGGSDSAAATTTVTIAAASAAGLASGLEGATLLTEAAAVAGDALVDTAIEAAEGMANALHAAAGRAAAAAAVNARAGAGTSAVRNGFLEYRSVVDQTRQNALEIGADAKLAPLVPAGTAVTRAALSQLVDVLPGPQAAEEARVDDRQATPPRAQSQPDSAPAPANNPAPSGTRIDITA